MVWRLRRKEWEAGKGEGNRKALRKIVTSGDEPGLLAYIDGKPVGWCAVAPRSVYGFLSRSRILKPVDDEPVWSVSCLFIQKQHRRQGIAVALLKAAVDFVGERGGRIVEGYPTERTMEKTPDAFVWTGTVSAFKMAGFNEVLRRSKNRPIMRMKTDLK